MVAQDCARVYRSNAVLTASPGQLVLMMFDGALRSLTLAREALARPEEDLRRIEIISSQLIKAQTIIGELQGSLNMEAGDGKFSQEMYRLYDFFIRRLIEANIRKQVEPVVEVERLLGDLRGAWAEMLCQQDSARSPGVRSVA